MTLFRALVQSLLGTHTPDLGWEPLAHGGIEAHVISGSHHTLLNQPNAAALWRALAVCLDQVASA